MKRSCILVALLCLVGIASASQISYTASVGLAPTNWNTVLNIPKFDTMGGTLTLQSIDITIDGKVVGQAGFENMSNAPVTVTLDLQAILRLKRPDNSNIWVQVVSATETASVEAKDGVVDFGAPAGHTFDTMEDNMSETVTLLSASDKALFTGTGDILLPLLAQGSLSYDGASNIILFASSNAAADVTVAYNYIPEPATLSLMALSGLAVLRRRK